MITKETAAKIYNCHQQIESCNKLISDMQEVLKQHPEDPRLINAFGERKGLELGVPSGSNSHRIFGVSPELSILIIEDHIAAQKRKLVELCSIAKIELYQISGKSTENDALPTQIEFNQFGMP